VGDDATVIAIARLRSSPRGSCPRAKGLRVFQAVVQDASGLIEVRVAGQPWLDRQINPDDVLLLSGPVRFFHGRQLARASG
jgi:ATP-dependent DNA helicase RecG